ncbi:EamA family transporter [Devosia sp. CN2-171]|jgi:probable blue pigment (indigoidine) exporter|uniref:EamA family transporter n=1 Tax=Devosia sp. CN2-171 TaxID=3400909 RepID=UPI003BF8E012
MNLKLAALCAAILWGFTYIITTTLLPHNPVFIGAVRALGGGLLLLVVARQGVPRDYWPKLIALGTLNFGAFFALLFVSAIRLPGGVAGTFQTLGPLMSILLTWALLRQPPTLIKIASIIVGGIGVTLVILRADAGIDMWGVGAALLSVVAGSLGGVLINRWGRPPEMGLTTFTSWQLIIGGVELAVLALILGDLPASIDLTNVLGLTILAVALTALPFILWFRAIVALGAASVIPFVLVTPIVAFILDAVIRHVVPSPLQLLGVVLVMAGLVINQWAGARVAKAA